MYPTAVLFTRGNGGTLMGTIKRGTMFYPYIKEAGLLWMMPIIFLSFCALAFCLERSWYWFVQRLNSQGRAQILENLFRTPLDVKKALRYCADSRDNLILTLREFLQHHENVALEIAERKTRLYAEARLEESRHFLDLLSLIASISGTLGLMGTVVGISLSFKTMAQDDSRGIALSLSTAMYTTIGGIMLFLLSYLFLFFFQKFSDRLENDMDVYIQKMKDLLEVQQKSRMIFSQDQMEKPSREEPQKVPARPLIFPDRPENGDDEYRVIVEIAGQPAGPAAAQAPLQSQEEQKQESEDNPANPDCSG